ncbi:hypothetical protein [Reinekea blandensis]|uniref:hypothetical protein n=1 Tax=Reinekea blandensis TaxID=374838 RepID=UPI00058C21CC|nr:hypothetical protein [Reinekea blandensis]
MGLKVLQKYLITTQSGIQSVRTYLGRTDDGRSLFGGVRPNGERFTAELKGSDSFVVQIRPFVEVAA